MPPKKHKKGGGGKKDQTNKLSELDKEVFQIHIRDLEDKLQRFQKICRELELRCASYKSHSEQMAADKYDTVEYLKQALEVRNNELDELQERLKGLQKARDVDRVAHEQLVAQLKVQYQEMKDQLTSENIVLDGKLASLEEFKAQKDKTFALIEELQNRLKCKEDEHREAMRLAEKNAILEKDQLKREMTQHLEEISAQFREMANQQMAETTRRAIQENVSLGAQIDRLKNKMAVVMVDNQRLIELKGNQLLRIGVLESMEHDLLGRNFALNKVLDDLRSKVKENDDKIMQIEPLLARSRRLEDDLMRAQTELKKFKDDASQKCQSNDALMNTLSELANKLEIEELGRTSMETVLQNAAVTLRDGIEVVNNQKDDYSFRDGILGCLLDILNAASATKKLPPPFFTGSIVNRRPSCSEDYLRGDIGIVPRSTTSSVCMQPQRRQVRTRTAATQTEHIATDGRSSVSLPCVSCGGLAQQKRSAAYRILQDIACSGTNFQDKFGDPMPRSRALIDRMPRH